MLSGLKPQSEIINEWLVIQFVLKLKRVLVNAIRNETFGIQWYDLPPHILYLKLKTEK